MEKIDHPHWVCSRDSIIVNLRVDIFCHSSGNGKNWQIDLQKLKWVWFYSNFVTYKVFFFKKHVDVNKTFSNYKSKGSQSVHLMYS